MKRFTFSCGCCHSPHPLTNCFTFDDEYAAISGVDRGVILILRDGGYDWLEIEEMLYDPNLMGMGILE